MPPARARRPSRTPRRVAPFTTHRHEPSTRRGQAGRHRRSGGRLAGIAFAALVLLGGVLLVDRTALANLPWGGLLPPERTEAAAQPEPAVPDVTLPAREEDRADRDTRPVIPSPSASAVTQAPGDFPASGSGSFVLAAARGPAIGTAGTPRRFHVAVEKGAGEDLAAFTSTVDEVLGDPRGWTASGQLRLQRVSPAERADFTIYLATAETARQMCAQGKVDIVEKGQPYTSCRAPGKVILNLARWRLSVPDYVAAGVPLDTYRQYMINHEVGHELGHGHELCPGKGRVAPVMQQQTLGLHGCAANAWPYLDGKRYAGPPGAYDGSAG
jgi:Protein of unknown function (DUF3152)